MIPKFLAVNLISSFCFALPKTLAKSVYKIFKQSLKYLIYFFKVIEINI